MMKCNACGGTFEPVLPDGMLYFHRCPPLSSAELAAAVLGGKIVLPGTETPEQAVTRRTYERATMRDENVTGPPLKVGDAAPIKAAGAGVSPVVAPVPPAIVVVNV